jgi:uncharacterized protein Usg
MREARLLVRGYRLTTAEILYHMPDYPELLQTFVWQELDIAPKYPILHKFLNFWRANLNGKLHSVRVAATGIIGPHEFRHADVELTLH